MLLQTISCDDFNKAGEAKSLNMHSETTINKLFRSEQVHETERGVQAVQSRSMSLRVRKGNLVTGGWRRSSLVLSERAEGNEEIAIQSTEPTWGSYQDQLLSTLNTPWKGFNKKKNSIHNFGFICR